MHLSKKWPKYAFAYAHMQMHNYPKPSDHKYHSFTKKKCIQNNRLMLPFG